MGNPISGQSKDWAAGERLRALALNRIGDSAAQNVGIFPGAFDYGGRFPGGTIRVPNSTGGSAAAAATNPPWAAYLTQDMSGDYQGNFYPGTIGGIVPSNIFSPLTLTQAQVNYAFVNCMAAAGLLTSASLSASTTYPTLAGSNPSTPPTSFIVPVGIFDLTASPAKPWNIVGFGNIWVQPFVTLLSTAPTGALLTAPFIPSYNWEWGGAAG